MVLAGIQDPALQPIYDKVAAGKRLTRQGTAAPVRKPDLWGWAAWPDGAGERLHGRQGLPHL